MDEGKFLYLLPYLLSLGLSLGILIYAFNHRRVRGATEFFWYSIGQTLWVAGFIVEMLSPGLRGKVFWDKFQWLASLVIPIVLPVFVVRYTQQSLPRLKKLAWTL
ncbi:MAG: histidine kinase N-terminal 7TM domain-containing protein, partial [Chloroflexota bacterium]